MSKYDVVLKMFISFFKFHFTAFDTFSQLPKKAKYLPENLKIKETMSYGSTIIIYMY